MATGSGRVARRPGTRCAPPPQRFWLGRRQPDRPDRLRTLSELGCGDMPPLLPCPKQPPTGGCALDDSVPPRLSAHQSLTSTNPSRGTCPCTSGTRAPAAHRQAHPPAPGPTWCPHTRRSPGGTSPGHGWLGVLDHRRPRQ
jgi:hypothetical protein